MQAGFLWLLTAGRLSPCRRCFASSTARLDLIRPCAAGQGGRSPSPPLHPAAPSHPCRHALGVPQLALRMADQRKGAADVSQLEPSVGLDSRRKSSRRWIPDPSRSCADHWTRATCWLLAARPIRVAFLPSRIAGASGFAADGPDTGSWGEMGRRRVPVPGQHSPSGSCCIRGFWSGHDRTETLFSHPRHGLSDPDGRLAPPDIVTSVRGCASHPVGQLAAVVQPTSGNPRPLSSCPVRQFVVDSLSGPEFSRGRSKDTPWTGRT